MTIILTPIRYRRLLVLAHRFLARLLSERQSSSRLAPLGIDTCRTLWTLDKREWRSDIARTLQSLYRPIYVDVDGRCSSDRVNEESQQL